MQDERYEMDDFLELYKMWNRWFWWICKMKDMQWMAPIEVRDEEYAMDGLNACAKWMFVGNVKDERYRIDACWYVKGWKI